MSQIRTEVTLHPETVAKAEQVVKARKKAQRKPKPAAPEVKRRYVKKPVWLDQRVWNEALKVSGNKPKRIVPLSPTAVIVANHE